ncbi:MAG: MBL fold metallo-hydrolase [Solirubrobacteraceae bacterium]
MIYRVLNTEVEENTWVCETGVPGRALVIDPGLSEDLVLAELANRDLTAGWVLLTHGHFDHIGSAATLQGEHGAEVWMHGADRKLVEKANFLLMACRMPQRIDIPTIDGVAEDGTTVAIGDEVATFWHAPGHSPGSCCIAWRDTLFSGDTIYRGHVGRDRFPGENREVLTETLRGLWDRIGDETTIRPGHGASATWGEIRTRNTALRELAGIDDDQEEAA